MNAVQVSDLRVTRGGREVLHGLEVSFAAGRVTGLFGPSGSGKSTLIRAITRLNDPTAGEVIFEGQDLLKASPQS